MKKLIGLAVLLLATVAVLVLWWPTTPPQDPLIPQPKESATATTATSAPTSPDSLASRVAAERQAVPEQPQTRPADETVIRGRCVAAEGGAPLAGCRVRLHGFARDRSGSGDETYTSPPRVVTGADGCFAITTKPPTTHRFILDLDADGYCNLRKDWNELPLGVIDAGDLPLSSGAVLVGRLIDDSGAPVGKTQISLSCESLSAKGKNGFYGKEFSNAGSRADGTLYTDQALAPGLWKVRMDTEQKLLRPTELVVAEGQRELRMDIIVQRAEALPAISGMVVDEQGGPVKGVRVTASENGMPFGDDSANSGPDGAFTIRKSRSKGETMQVRVDERDDHQQIGKPESVAWGSKDVRIRVRPLPGLRVRVVEADTGKPVETYALRCIPLEGNSFSSLDSAMRERGRHEDGVATLKRVRPGKNRVIVYPDAPELVSSAGTVVVVDESAGELRVELRKREVLGVRLRTAAGRPVANSRVELLRKEGTGELTIMSIAGTAEEAYDRFSGPLMGIVLAAAVTDAEGRTTLRGPAGAELYVKARGPGHTPIMRSGVTIPRGGAEIELVVELGAVIKGKVGPLEVLAKLGPTEKDRARAARFPDPETYLASQRPKLQMAEIGGAGRKLPADFNGALTMTAEGIFAIDGVPAGDWQINLYYLRRLGSGGGSYMTHPLLRVSGLKDGETREVQLDASELLPATVSGRVLLDGEPYRQRKAHFSGKEFTTDAEGAFSVEVSPGDHRLALILSDDPMQRYAGILHEEALHVRAGEKVERVFDVRKRRARIRVLEADGTPATERQVVNQSGPSPEPLAVDKDGWVVIDPAPPHAIRLYTWPKGMTTATAQAKAATGAVKLGDLQIQLGQIQMPDGQVEGKFELKVPEGK